MVPRFLEKICTLVLAYLVKLLVRKFNYMLCFQLKLRGAEERVSLCICKN